MTGPEHNPTDDEQPTRKEWELYELRQRAEAAEVEVTRLAKELADREDALTICYMQGGVDMRQRAEQAEAKVAELEADRVQLDRALVSAYMDGQGSIIERAEAAEARVKKLEIQLRDESLRASEIFTNMRQAAERLEKENAVLARVWQGS